MGTETKINWADHTFNPWIGCDRVSDGCKNCYALASIKRFGVSTEVHEAAERMFEQLTFRDHKKKNSPYRWAKGDKVFVCSWSDFFHSKADAFRDKAYKKMLNRPDLRYIFLTKRPEGVKERLCPEFLRKFKRSWIGVTVENQHNIHRIEDLCNATSHTNLFLSCEPLIGEINLSALSDKTIKRIKWIIVGGESNSTTPMNPFWITKIYEFCKRHDIRFFFKQWGSFAPCADDDDGNTFKLPTYDAIVNAHTFLPQNAYMKKMSSRSMQIIPEILQEFPYGMRTNKMRRDYKLL
ncbi:MAG: DUF5131 family protein [Candidatus Peribacteraceae bacterium]|nr:DUF5131 family protein [Candidatus Peribacteraceae bacterium]